MGTIVQFTGLSGAGKTTLAEAFLNDFSQKGYRIKIIDGDVYRQTLCKDLGFSRADRIENISRLGKLAHELSADYDYIIIAAINPFDESRNLLQRKYGAALVYIHCELPVLQKRDTKGLYKRAALDDGHIEKVHNLTGVNDVFEAPIRAELFLDTTTSNIEQTLKKFILFVSRFKKN